MCVWSCNENQCSFFLQQPLTAILKIDSDLHQVKLAVWEARSEWRNIGRALRLSDGTIRSIHDSEDGECLHKVLTFWMQSGNATIQDLLAALEDPTVARRDIANEIRSRKCV